MNTKTTEEPTRAQWLSERAELQRRVVELEAQLQQAQAGMGKQLRFTEALLAAIPTAVFFKDAQGRYLGCNNAFTEQMGVTTEKIKGKTVHEIWPSEQAEVYHQQDLALMAHPERQVYEFKVRDKDGQTRHVIFAKNVFYDEHGQVAGLVGAYVDITERKKAEEVLHLQSLVLDQIMDHVTITDLNGVITYVNQAEERTMQHSRQDILGQSTAIYGEDAERGATQREILTSTLRDGFWRGEVVNFATDGSEHIMDSRIQIIYNEEGIPIALCGIATDITERKKMEAELRESEERYRATVNAVDDYIHGVDRDLRILFCNTAFTRELARIGITEGPQGKSLFDLLPFLTEKSRSEYQRVLDTGVLLTTEEPTHIGPTVRWTETRKIPVCNDEGGVERVVTIIRDITERKQTEVILRESEERFRELADSITDVFFALDENLKYVYWNTASERLIGIPAQEAIGKSIYDIFPDTPQTKRAAEVYREVLSTQSPQTFVNEYHLNGEEYFFEINVYPSKRGLSVFAREISERIQQQQALRQERDLSRALAGAAALISSTLDPDEVLDQLLDQVSRVVPNDAANVMLIEPDNQVRIVRWRGYQRFGAEKFISTAIFDLTAVSNLRQMAETGDPLVIPDTYAYPDWVYIPEQVWLRSYASAPIRVRGVVIGFLNVDSATPGFFTPLHTSILSTFADHAAVALENARLYHATEQELAERKRAESALRASEQRYRRLFERSNDAIFLVDRRTGRYLGANTAAEKLTGRSVAELQQLTLVDIISPADREILAQVLTTQQTLKMGEVHYSRPDGRIRTALLDVVSLNAQTVFGIARDITGRKEIEERLQRQNRLAAIGQLAAGIAHDFRNLLTTIIIYAQLGQRKHNLPSGVVQYLEVIVGEARKATDLVRQILDFGRGTEINRHLLDLVTFTADIVSILQRTLPENIDITFTGKPGECVIEGDAGRLQQALTNLALNARDAMPDGGELHIAVTRIPVVPGTIPPVPEMVETFAPPAWICLSITDTGMGMSEEVYAHLFEPFFTTKEDGKGTGLGLAQVYGIIQLHAGYIDVKTQVGHGVTFRIYLPAVTVARQDNVEVAPAALEGHGETLLLVEDNAHLRDATQKVLTALGYRVLTAANGREALAIYQSESMIALLITDLVMPEMGGKTLVQALLNHIPHLKALAMTGYTADESTEDLQAAGFLDIVRKPFDAETLAWIVRRALDENDAST
ncbi:MAG: PAS domain-containing protein [Anaerolineae bacterium]|nr:PAS domain-containing protein [Anaerolineae bacterium]